MAGEQRDAFIDRLVDRHLSRRRRGGAVANHPDEMERRFCLRTRGERRAGAARCDGLADEASAAFDRPPQPYLMPANFPALTAQRWIENRSAEHHLRKNGNHSLKPPWSSACAGGARCAEPDRHSVL